MTDPFYNRPGDTEIARIPLDVSVPQVDAGSDAGSIGIIKRLTSELFTRASRYAHFDAYYNGEHGMRFSSQDHKAAFGATFGKYAENFCGLVVDAVEERLDIEGFRIRAGESAEAADPAAWQIWQDNQLDAGSQIAHTEALVKGVVYVLVGQFEAERVAGRSPLITIEDPCQTIVEYAAGTRQRLVGMKRWSDTEAKVTYATLYFPDRIEKWQTATRRWGNQYQSGVVLETENWIHRIDPRDKGLWPLKNELDVVPLVPLINRPRLVGEGRSEIADIIPIQDAINKLATDELVTSDTASFPQRWATGTEIPIDDATGKAIEPFRAAIDRFISTTAPDAKFGQFDAAELKGYIEAIAQKVQAIASISRTPYHYFLQHGGQPPSGESLKSSETGLVRKARRKQRHFGEGWEEVIRLAFKALGDARGDVFDSEAKWANPESMTEAEHIDALTKQRQTLHVPLQVLWEEAGYSPVRRAAFKQMLEDERTWLNAAPVATTQPVAVPGPQDTPPVQPLVPAGGTSNGR